VPGRWRHERRLGVETGPPDTGSALPGRAEIDVVSAVPKITSGRKTASAEITAGRKRGYISNYNPQRKTIELLDDVDRVLAEYRDHLPLACRQIFYRLVGAHGYPKDEGFYARLCHHMVNARRARRIPFDWIRDDGVSVISEDHYDDEEHFHATVNYMARNYRRDKLARQPVHIEVWCEAAGMLPQLAKVANKYSIDVYSCSGFDSLPAKRMIVDRLVDNEKSGVILHLGDFDPSGECMFQAVAEDVAAFLEDDRRDARQRVRFERVALTPEQVRQFELPTAPAKKTDSRTKKWAEAHGSDESCQLEALPPDILAELLDEAIRAELDLDQLDDDLADEKIERRRLLALPAPGE
jgi:hypothetical protein